jgi:DNA-binding SARP family transcriptional activator/predicted ATPase/Tfp pilus assembly protein PilF
MVAEQEGQLILFGPPRWQAPEAAPRDVPDNLPGYLLVYLACQGTWVSREALAAAFWPRRTEDEALANLRANLHRVRSLLAGWQRADALRTEARRVRVELGTDVAALRAALARADWLAAARIGAEAPLAALSFRGYPAVEEWVAGQRRALAAAWRDAALKAAPALAERDPAGAADLLLRVVDSEVSNEAALKALLPLAGGAGRRDEALAAYERCCRWLGDELQLQPGPDIAALAAALRSGAANGGRGEGPAAAAAPAQARLLLFGQPVLNGATPTAFRAERRFQLLTVLAVRAGQWVGRDELAALLWPGQSTADGRRNLRHTLFKAREIAGAEGIEASEHALRWDVDTDLGALQRAARQRRHADAVPLRRGALAAGLDDAGNRSFSEWLAAERARADALWRQAALDGLPALQAPSERLAVAQALLQVDPFDEQAMAALLAAEVALGHRARAQRLYRDYAARLAEELGVEPPQRLRDLLADGASGAGAAGQQDDGFVGRRTELAELGLLLGQPDCRLITIVGPGGVGKSSLARRALAQAQPRFAGGAVWVELQDLDGIGTVPARLARQFGIDLKDAQDPVPQIAARLRGGRSLAVLDNAEHLADLPALLDRLLEAAPSLTVMLTSRVRMHSRHERLLPLEGLAVPDDESRDLEVAATFDAVRLFEARARAAQRGFALAPHLAAVIEIVDAVGGLPLAIELAASWVRLLPPAEIARDLRQSLAVLERDPAAAVPARPEHGSVQAVLDRSWQLLAPREREAMAALSVFQGGFMRSAALAVADVPLPVLSSLVDKSFLTVDRQGRFGIHPLVAAYSAARAEGSAPGLETYRQRHADYFARALAELAPSGQADHTALVAAVDAEFANCLAAWRHACARRQAEPIAEMAPALGTYFDIRGRYSQGVAELRAALDLPAADPASQRAGARARSALAGLLHRKRDLDLGLTVALAGIELAEGCGERQALTNCLSYAGSCHSVLGRWDLARPYFERALAIAREDGDRLALAASLLNLGVCEKKDGRFDEALRLYSQSLALERELQRHAAVGRCLNNIGVLHMERNDWAQAREIMAQGLRHCEQYGLVALAPFLENGLGLACFELGQLDEAERHLGRARRRAREAEVKVVELNAAAFLARVAARRGRFDEARERFRAVAHEARQSDSIPDLLDVAMYYAELLRDTGRRIEAACAWHMVIAHPMAEAGVRGSCTRCLEELALTEEERIEVERRPETLTRLIEDLLGDRPLDEGTPLAA